MPPDKRELQTNPHLTTELLRDLASAVVDHRVKILKGLGALAASMTAVYVAQQISEMDPLTLLKQIPEVGRFTEEFHKRASLAVERDKIEEFRMPIFLSNQPLEAAVDYCLRDNDEALREDILPSAKAFGPSIQRASARPLREGLGQVLFVRSFAFNSLQDGRLFYSDITGEARKYSPPLLSRWRPT